jgi:hypothetical protein
LVSVVVSSNFATIRLRQISMPKNPESPRLSWTIWVYGLFFGSFSLVLLSVVVGLFDTTTELVPAHEKIQQFLLVFAGLCGLMTCGAGVYFTRGLKISQRIVLPLVFLFETAIGVFLMGGHLASIAEGWIDFPAGRTHTEVVPMQISRAYETHGKGSSQYIQTMPIWSTLEITRADFVFMRDHRRSEDDVKDTDEIKSRGYFCAMVTVEWTDKAVRILHAGSDKLPAGTVVVCPGLYRAH